MSPPSTDGANAICASFLLYLRLRLVGLPAAGYGVANTSTRGGVHRLHDDEGPLLQRGHGQVSVIRHRLQVGAEARPHRVSHLQDARLVGPHLGVREGGGSAGGNSLCKTADGRRDAVCYDTNREL